MQTWQHRLIRIGGGVLAAVIIAGSAFALTAHALARPANTAFVRVNQVGYLTNEPKQAILMASASETGATFGLLNTSTNRSVYHAGIGTARGAWSSTYSKTYLIDFSRATTPGTYKLVVYGPVGAVSPAFAIGSGAQLYQHLLPNAEVFYQVQRDGPDVNSAYLDRQPSHLKDETASIYATPTYDSNDVLQGNLTKIGGPIDASGGWFDAGDYLKFVQTASYTDAVMLFAARQYPTLFDGGAANFRGEGKYGLDWLQKMWDQQHRTLYYQVGIGDGNGTTINADHDYWRLPQVDDQLNAKPGDLNYYVEYRPVFRAGPPGASISPNLAGRLAADFALCYQVFHASDPNYANACLRSGETVFDLAQTTHVNQLLTAAPFDYYPETEWRDDLELGATELYDATAQGHLLTGLPHSDPSFYLRQAATWAHAYITGPNDAADSLNLYDVSGLAHYELYRAIQHAGHPSGLAVTQTDLLTDLRLQLTNGTTQAASDPFGLGVIYGQADASPHALGYFLEASWYDELTHGHAFQTFGLTERNWILGANAWGSSFIVGAGSTFPHCMQHQVANLSGSLNGTAPLVLGATTDGPNAASNFDGLGVPDNAHACPPKGGDPFKAFSGKGARYLDNVIAWPSVEPADDYTTLGILVFARLSTGNSA